MKVKIGNYITSVTPYRLISFLEKLGVNDDQLDRIHDRIAPYLAPLCNLINRLRGERKVKIKIDRWDSWDGGHTLAMVALPLVKAVVEKKQGAPCVDYEDVPEHLRPTPEEIIMYSTRGETDDKFFLRWDWVAGEIIYALDAIVNDSLEEEFYTEGTFDFSGYQKACDRVDYGMLLFGKYFRSLWT